MDWLYLFDKPERISALYNARKRKVISERKFWRAFGGAWVTSENIFDNLYIISEILDDVKTNPLYALMMRPKDRKWLNALSQPLQIYRGCGSHNYTGWSWTTDRKCADAFVKRTIDHTGYVLSTTVDFNDIIAYMNDRDEHEIIVNPKNIKDVKIIDQQTLEYNLGKNLFWLTQTGRFNTLSPETITAMAIHNNNVSSYIEFYEYALDWYIKLGFADKALESTEILNELYQL